VKWANPSAGDKDQEFKPTYHTPLVIQQLKANALVTTLPA